MSARHVLASFERYQRERLNFASSALEYAREALNVDALVGAGGITLLTHLADDPAPGIQHIGTLALGRLASHSRAVAAALIKEGFHNVLAARLSVGAGPEGGAAAGSPPRPEQLLRRAAALALRGLTKHDAELAQQVAVGSGVVEAAVACLGEHDAELQEAAGWVLGNIAGHAPELAELVAEAGGLASLTACLASRDLAVKRIAASALSDIVQHGSELAQRVVEAGAVPQLAAALQSVVTDAKLKRQACCALGQIAKASPELAAEVAAHGPAIAEVVRCLDFNDALVRRHAAVALRDMAKHGEATAQAVADTCLPQLVAAAAAPGEQMLPAIMALGFISATTESLGSKVLDAGAVEALVPVLAGAAQDHMASAAVWALGQVGRHSATHAKAVADAGGLFEMARLEAAPASSEDLRAKCAKALNGMLSQLTDITCLELLVQRPLPPPALELVMQQIAAALAANPTARTAFVESGALKAVEELGEAPGSPFREHMQRITTQFPEEIVQYYSPSYSKQLLSKLAEPAATVEPPVPEAAEDAAARQAAAVLKAASQAPELTASVVQA